jgi:capsular exopolysaccharide synthesis family protein
MNTSSQIPYYEFDEEESFNIKRYISLFISNWYWFAVAMLISISLAYGINRWSEKKYVVSSTLLIRGDQNANLSNIFPGSDAYRSQQNLKNEIGILKSYNLNKRVMKQLPDFYIQYTKVGKRGIAETRMYKDCPFIVVFDTLENQTSGKRIDIKIISGQKYKIRLNGNRDYEKELSFGERFNEMSFDFRIYRRSQEIPVYYTTESNKYYFSFICPEILANIYRSKLSVIPIEEDASLVSLSTSGPVPEQEIDYLNKLMDVYLAFGLEYKNLTAAQTLDFIENQLGIISDSLRRAEGALENFRLVNRLIDLSREGTLIQSKLEGIDAERTRLFLQKSYYEYLKDYVDSKKESGDIVAPSVMGVTDQMLMGLVTQLSQFQLQKKQMAMNIYESAEPLKLIEANIIAVRQAISENITDGLKNIENSIAGTGLRLSGVEKEIRKLPSTERQMINIQRKFDINNTVYTYLLEKRAEAGIAKASNVPDNRIIDHAGSFSSSRILPKERQNLLIAIILGLFIPLAGIVLIDYLNNKIIDKKDVEKGTKAPIVGFISHNRLKTEMPVIESPGSTIAESFRSVRTNLKYFIKDTKCPVISVSSTITDEGKTFISANLAAIIAMSGKKVLLVGLDLRKPRIHRILGIKNDGGLSDYLIGEKDYKDVIIKTETDNLWYLPAGPVPPNPSELIESPKMNEFISRAKKEFEYIIIDTPPVAIVTDALLVSPVTDFYIFVVRQRYTSKNTLELINELHKNENIKRIGIVINDINVSGYYGYGLRYGYSFGYGYNYGYNYYGYYGKYGYSDSGKGYYKDET